MLRLAHGGRCQRSPLAAKSLYGVPASASASVPEDMRGSLFDQENKLAMTAEALALATVVLDLITSISE